MSIKTREIGYGNEEKYIIFRCPECGREVEQPMFASYMVNTSCTCWLYATDIDGDVLVDPNGYVTEMELVEWLSKSK